MTTSELRPAVAGATGESVREIHQPGCDLAKPCELNFDPESHDRPPSTVDWDQLDSGRLSLFP